MSGALWNKTYVIDWLVPDMKGIEIARQIRKEVGDNAPIIILTAYDWSDIEEDKRKALEAVMNAHIAKPIVKRLLDELERIPGQGQKSPGGAMRLCARRILCARVRCGYTTER